MKTYGMASLNCNYFRRIFVAVPSEFKYSKEHEWVKVEGNTATIGITEYAQGELGDIVFVELPDVDDEINEGIHLVVLNQ